MDLTQFEVHEVGVLVARGIETVLGTGSTPQRAQVIGICLVDPREAAFIALLGLVLLFLLTLGELVLQADDLLAEIFDDELLILGKLFGQSLLPAQVLLQIIDFAFQVLLLRVHLLNGVILLGQLPLRGKHMLLALVFGPLNGAVQVLLVPLVGLTQLRVDLLHMC